jgi:hypothetical protein
MRNNIGDIGLPYGIPVSIDLKTSILLSKASLNTWLSKNDDTQRIRLVGSNKLIMICNSLFLDM